MRFASVQHSLMLPEDPAVLCVEVAYALPDRQWVVQLSLPAGATVADALAAVARQEPFSQLALEQMPVGIYGELAAASQVLQAFDRVELYRSLHQDPKAARRLRAEQTQGRSI